MWKFKVEFEGGAEETYAANEHFVQDDFVKFVDDDGVVAAVKSKYVLTIIRVGD